MCNGLIAKWMCTDVDWEDTDTISNEQKMACAYYAEANRLGLLYCSVQAQGIDENAGRLIELTSGVGPLKETKRWAENKGASAKNPLESIDALMLLGCRRINSSSGKVIVV